MKKIIILGGGISGLVTAIQLARQDLPVILIEKKTYPFHRVCGEYISNEAKPFLRSAGLFPDHLNPPPISKFRLTSVNGKAAQMTLDLGGFGVSRFAFDQFLSQQAVSSGARIVTAEVTGVHFEDDSFRITTGSETFHGDLVIGAHGKRSKIDVQMDRGFVGRRSPYVGVKYHIRSDNPSDLISLHNFKDGYCGLSNVEGGRSNLCYLTHRENIRKFGSIKAMEEAVLFRNPFLKSIFRDSDFLVDKPETINEISFETKGLVEQHVLMTGDAAGMITPLCGNGMAMAIHSAKIVSACVVRHSREPGYTRRQLESDYEASWKKHFARRLWAGRQIQSLFGGEAVSNFAVKLMRNAKPLAEFLIRQTHGPPFTD